LHRLVREHCDLLVRISVVGKLEALKISMATGRAGVRSASQRDLTQRGLESEAKADVLS
jgi:tRNA G18 (ribose-2'-O)-methylase SpoU